MVVSELTTAGHTYHFPHLRTAVTTEDCGTVVCSHDELRVFGFGDTLEAALAEWAHVFHLNYETFVTDGDPLSPSGQEYADQLRKAVTTLHADESNLGEGK